MSTLTVEVPDSLHAVAGELARASGISVDQLMASALAEKVSAMAGSDWLAIRAARANRAKFEDAMNHVADVEPEQHDRL